MRRGTICWGTELPWTMVRKFQPLRSEPPTSKEVSVPGAMAATVANEPRIDNTHDDIYAHDGAGTTLQLTPDGDGYRGAICLVLDSETT